jgi:hypothetical protein
VIEVASVRYLLAARGMLRSDADAEDVTQDALLTVLTSLSTYVRRPDARFAAWVTTIAVNTARRRFRRRRPEVTATGELPDTPADAADPTLSTARGSMPPLPPCHRSPGSRWRCSERGQQRSLGRTARPPLMADDRVRATAGSPGSMESVCSSLDALTQDRSVRMRLMIARVALGASLMVAAAWYPDTLAQSRAASDALLGRWDLVVQRGTQTSPSWLEVERSGTATLVGQFVGSGGSARPIAKIEFADGTFRFAIPPQWESNPRDITFEGRLEGDRITGSMTMGDGQKVTWAGTRAPSLRRAKPPAWGQPITLFDGKSLDGWRPIGRRDSQWRAVDGIPQNASSSANLVTVEKFDDFNCTWNSACPGVPTAACTCEAVTNCRSTMRPASSRPRIISAASTASLPRARTPPGLPASGNRWMSRSPDGCSRTS